MWEGFQYENMISKEELETFLKEGRIRPSSQLNSFMRVPENANYVCEAVLGTLVDELSLGVVFGMHYEASRGVDEQEDMEVDERVVDSKHTDIFGEPIVQKKTQKCVCPTCKHSLAASRFAPHLAKCLGLGRISSRIASRRIASNSRGEAGCWGGAPSDDDDDADWTAGADRRRRKRGRPRPQRLVPSGVAVEERRGPRPHPVEADPCEESEVGRGWELEHSNTSSPADSASTSSSSSKKRDKLPRAKAKMSKNHKGSPTVLTSLPSLAD
ncbi:SAGA-associated factor 11 homolog [Bacillus rossius redtenbacheri]|uniref:SAGA-associated factor 11 homolog n=1 Tax=Bacillus rossius redtenbacheri TaxID=93214 RepID=UPI002FDD20A6